MHQRCVRYFVPDESTYQDADAGTDDARTDGPSDWQAERYL